MSDTLSNGPQRPLPPRLWPVIRHVANEAISQRVPLVAAGCAFYAMLALFPALSMLIFIYGLAFDVTTVEPQLELVRRFLPESAYQLISERIRLLVSNRSGSLGVGLAVTLSITMWSSMAGTKALISALNLAYAEAERRGFLSFNLTALAITLGGVVATAIGIAVLIALPATLSLLGVPSSDRATFRMMSLGTLFVCVIVALAVLYRFGPSREDSRAHRVFPGAMFAALIWGVASWGFSLYVSEIGGYDATYGPLGAFIGLMMWFWVSVFVILLGAELNAALEREKTTLS